MTPQDRAGRAAYRAWRKRGGRLPRYVLPDVDVPPRKVLHWAIREAWLIGGEPGFRILAAAVDKLDPLTAKMLRSKDPAVRYRAMRICSKGIAALHRWRLRPPVFFPLRQGPGG